PMTAAEVGMGMTQIDLCLRTLNYEDSAQLAVLATLIEQVRTTCTRYQAIYDASDATTAQEIEFITRELEPLDGEDLDHEILGHATQIVDMHFEPLAAVLPPRTQAPRTRHQAGPAQAGAPPRAPLPGGLGIGGRP
ncbi:hypothetical protein HDU77_001626, partial [Chytriomyces hyalinus]